jgi:RNA polymerase sigma-70 factor (ECF subfamily)
MSPGADEELESLRGAGEDRDEVLGRLFDAQRARLRRMIDVRLDPRLRARVDPSDVLQEAWLEVSARLEDYLRRPQMPFTLWVRFIAGQKILALRRHHVGAQKRDSRRETRAVRGAGPEASTAAMVDQLVASGTTPSDAAVREELRTELAETLDRLPALDREVLVLRHFEQLGNTEVAALLGLSESAASNRYVRALDRLRSAIEGAGGACAPEPLA